MKNKRIVIVVVICMMFVLMAGGCTSDDKGNDGSSVPGNVPSGGSNDEQSAADLPADVLARVDGIDITKEQVEGIAAFITINSNLNYDDLSDENKASIQNSRLINLVNAEMARAAQPNLVADVQIESLKDQAAEMYKKIDDGTYDLATLHVTSEVIAYYLETQLIRTEFEKMEGNGDVDTAYATLREKAKIVWSGSLTIDSDTGLPTIGSAADEDEEGED
jgi:hypothetical protein